MSYEASNAIETKWENSKNLKKVPPLQSRFHGRIVF